MSAFNTMIDQFIAIAQERGMSPVLANQIIQQALVDRRGVMRENKKLTEEAVKQIIKEEVGAALEEAADKKQQLRQAVEAFMAETGLNPEDAIALKLAIKKQMRSRPKQRHPALQGVLGQWWAMGPDFEADVNDVAYEITVQEKPVRSAQPEEEETEADRLRRVKRVAAIDAKMGGRYR